MVSEVYLLFPATWDLNMAWSFPNPSQFYRIMVSLHPLMPQAMFTLNMNFNTHQLLLCLCLVSLLHQSFQATKTKSLGNAIGSFLVQKCFSVDAWKRKVLKTVMQSPTFESWIGSHQSKRALPEFITQLPHVPCLEGSKAASVMNAVMQ